MTWQELRTWMNDHPWCFEAGRPLSVSRDTYASVETELLRRLEDDPWRVITVGPGFHLLFKGVELTIAHDGL